MMIDNNITSKSKLTLIIHMRVPIYVDTMSFELFILHFNWSHANVSTFLSLKIVSILTDGTGKDPDDMLS